MRKNLYLGLISFVFAFAAFALGIWVSADMSKGQRAALAMEALERATSAERAGRSCASLYFAGSAVALDDSPLMALAAADFALKAQERDLAVSILTSGISSAKEQRNATLERRLERMLQEITK